MICMQTLNHRYSIRRTCLAFAFTLWARGDIISNLLNPEVDRLGLSSRARSSKILENPEAKKLLQGLREKGVSLITPVILGNGDISYPEASALLGDETQSLLVIEALAEARILLAERANPRLRCPSCNTDDTVQSLVCPSCGGSSLISGAAIQHLSCLHFDFESKFQSKSGTTFCPKCEKPLTSLGTDYLRSNVIYKCLACEKFNARAKRLYSCNACQQVFETARNPEVEIFRYRLNSDMASAIAQASFDSKVLIGTIKDAGYVVSENCSIEGRSGAHHIFSIVARIPKQEKSADIVGIDIVFEAPEVGAMPILALFAKTLDCLMKRRVIVAFPKISHDAKLLARSYGIHIIEGESQEAAAYALRKLLLVNRGPNGSDGESPIDRRASSSLKKANSTKRSSMDIMADILAVVMNPSGKAEIMTFANLSYEQTQKYLPALEKLGLLERNLLNGAYPKYAITERGREYLSNVTGEFGTMAEGEKSIWNSRRKVSGPSF